MKDSWVGFGYHMALHKENFTSVTAYYQEVHCFLVEIHFPVLLPPGGVYLQVCALPGHTTPKHRALCGLPREISFLVPQGEQSSGGDPRSGWQHSTSDHLLPPGVQLCSELCSTLPFATSACLCGSRTAAWEGQRHPGLVVPCSTPVFLLSSGITDLREGEQWALSFLTLPVSQNYLVWMGPQWIIWSNCLDTEEALKHFLLAVMPLATYISSCDLNL